MAKPPRVSVVMAAYNGGRFLREAVESILSQDFRDFELIVVDDASTDDTAAIVESYPDPRIRLIRNPRNFGISRTRNIGIDAARGEYLAALDHDDISLPERLERQVAFLDAHPDVVLLGTGARLLENGQTRDYYRVVCEPHLLRWTLMTHCPLIHSSVCIRLSALRENGLRYRAEYPCAEDFDLYHCLAKVGKIACLPDRLTVYREHGGNASTRQAQLMHARGQAFLLDVYRELLGGEVTADDVRRVWETLTCRGPAASREDLLGAGDMLSRLLEAFLAKPPLTAAQEQGVRRAASRTWWLAVQRTAKALGPGLLRCHQAFPALTAYRPSVREKAAATVLSALGPKVLDPLRSIVAARRRPRP